MPLDTFSLVNKTSLTFPHIPFKRIKEAVLGKRYDLSLALVGKAESRALTRKTKHKDKVSNVLAFPLSKDSGEIIICPGGSGPYTPAYLFIHGLFHLRGFQHGVTMERAEDQILARFKTCKKLLQESTSARTKLRSS